MQTKLETSIKHFFSFPGVIVVLALKIAVELLASNEEVWENIREQVEGILRRR
jgi:recombinational DNA repair protein RecR